MAKVNFLGDDYVQDADGQPKVGPSVQERRLKLDRITYVGDMSDETYERLITGPLAEFLNHENTRRVVPQDVKAHESSTAPETLKDLRDLNRDESAEARKWGREATDENGARRFPDVKDKGRIDASLKAAFLSEVKGEKVSA